MQRDGTPGAEPMRILVIAHEFPPIPSPQSLRWSYLVRELAALGHRVDVLAPDHPGYGPQGGLPELPDSVTVHRTSPGGLTRLLHALVQWRRRHRQARTDGAPVVAENSKGSEAVVTGAPGSLNWKGRSVDTLRRLYAWWWLFPDIRAEWTRPARRALRSLLATLSPDLVIVSHEPASTLPLGLLARQQGHRLMADLGDPVCAPYTPRRWRRRAMNLERRICEQADLVTVTTEATRQLLVRRHGIDAARIHVMPQGFDGLTSEARGRPAAEFDPSCFELLYTGSFYPFRRYGELLDAVVRTPGARITIASQNAPPFVSDLARRYPDSIRLLGFVTHAEALALQGGADLLVNLANDDPSQVPGKIYEYLGAGRPILHIGDVPDEAALLLQRTGAGRACPNRASAIAAELAVGVARKAGKTSVLDAERDEAALAAFTWSAHASALMRRLGADVLEERK